ncbi:MAG: 2TM domain-containing protein [Myxococcota bacterium]
MADYSDDEVSEILGRALSKDDVIGLSHEELAEVAAEVGITTEELEKAAAEVRSERVRQSDRAEAEHAVTVHKRRQRRGWLRHFATYGVITAGLALLNLTTGGSAWWVYPAIGWGMAVALHGSRVLFSDDDAELQRQLRRIERRREKARKAAQKKKKAKTSKGLLSDAETAFESALERGVALLLTKAAEKIEAATAPPVPADSDFGRFVAQKKGVPMRVGTDGEARGPQTRVDPLAPEEVEVELPTKGREAER